MIFMNPASGGGPHSLAHALQQTTTCSIDKRSCGSTVHNYYDVIVPTLTI